MLKRTLLGILLLSGGATAAAEPWHEHLDAPEQDPVMKLGESHWELYRPTACRQELFDLDFAMQGLRADKPGFGLRFRSTPMLTIDFRFDPITDSEDFVGPVYDRHIGAATLTFAVNF